MYKLKVFSVGKTKEAWLDEAINEYLKRLQKIATIEFIWAKDDEQLVSLATKEPSLICLDSHGAMLDSVEFSSFITRRLEEGGSRLAIVIGGAEGLPAALRNNYVLVSFSKMTFTHQIVRLILIEQLYRALEIAKGSRYHK